MKRIERMPKTLCVQQASCAPMVHAHAEGSPTIEPRHVVQNPSGIAEAILRGDPSRAYPYVRRIVIDSGGGLVAVSEQEIREARSMVEELEGLSPCFSSATAVAGVIKQVRAGNFPLDETVLINLTGADRPDSPQPGNVQWLARDGDNWVAEA
jgi:threonine synthase